MGINLVGTWQNELGSRLTIESVQSGVLSGTYQTAVSSGACAQGKFQVSGVTDTDSGDGGNNIGFAVSWRNDTSNCKSVTAWSGQVFNPGPNQVIFAFWLLTVESGAADVWQDTLIGQDTFWYGASQTPKVIAEKSKVVRRSHP
jgi:hypothetical protein